jgi:hypothetical protein
MSGSAFLGHQVLGHQLRNLTHLISRRSLVAGLGAMLTTGVAAQPFGPGRLRGLQGATHTPHIDVHMHLVGGQQRTFSEAVEECAARMQEFGITKGVVMGRRNHRPAVSMPPTLFPSCTATAVASHFSVAAAP